MMTLLYQILTSCLLLLYLLSETNSTHTKTGNTSREKAPPITEGGTSKTKLNKNRIKLAETYFLKFMGVDRKPHKHIIEKIKVPEHMWKLYYKWSNANTKDENVKEKPDTARIFFENENATDLKPTQIQFDIRTKGLQKEKVHKAELHLFVQPKHSKRKTFSVREHLKVYLQPANTSTEGKKMIHTRKLLPNSIGWLKVDVTTAVRQWLNESGENRSLADFADSDGSHLIVVHGKNGQTNHSKIHLRQRRSSPDEPLYEDEAKRPMLYVYSSEDRAIPSLLRDMRQDVIADMDLKVRQRRSSYHDYDRQPHFSSARKKRCRKHSYVLMFEDIGWHEWIIAPKQYAINFCAGDCPTPLGAHSNTTNHAVIQATVYDIEPTMVPPLCCIPTVLRDKTFLYLDGFGKIVLKNPEQMIAEGCGCR